MSKFDTTAEGHRSRVFATTHWSVVLAAGQEPSAPAQNALESLCQAYWYPVYAYGQVSKRLEMGEGAVRGAVHRLRQRYGELLRAQIAQTVSHEDQADEELREGMDADPRRERGQGRPGLPAPRGLARERSGRDSFPQRSKSPHVAARELESIGSNGNFNAAPRRTRICKSVLSGWNSGGMMSRSTPANPTLKSAWTFCL